MFHAHHHALGHLVGTKDVEVGVVGQFLAIHLLWIMTQHALGFFRTIGQIEIGGHLSQVDEGYILFFGNHLHGSGEVTVSIPYCSVFLKLAALGGRTEHNLSTLGTNFINKYL